MSVSPSQSPHPRCWTPCAVTTTTGLMSTASGANPRTCLCSSGSRRATTGKKSTKVSAAAGGLTRLVVGPGGHRWFHLSQLCLCPRREPCTRYSNPKGGASEPGTAHCRHHTTVFAIGVSHTVLFLEDQTERLCQTRVNLSQHCKTSVNHPQQMTESRLLVVTLLLVLAQ